MQGLPYAGRSKRALPRQTSGSRAPARLNISKVDPM
ncbi:hypothetical protein ACTIVE_0353 [Actinomadura verrucosospora]|uniref:Uncharacterized protein n=1 Tax=Actinomadura verrucosospora TaxID=46165 RepID=A0A7D3VPD6_ACTVE|nr:hypothetical protein ACTIVE_0353 [Actinomadura verrucosospora]